MADFTLSISGLDRLIQVLDQVPTQVQIDTKEELATAAYNTFDQSQSYVPVDKGDLKASGRVEETANGYEIVYGDGNSSGKTYNYPEGTADGYSWFTELGTTKMAAQPYLGPAFEEESQAALTRIGNILS